VNRWEPAFWSEGGSIVVGIHAVAPGRSVVETVVKAARADNMGVAGRALTRGPIWSVSHSLASRAPAPVILEVASLGEVVPDSVVVASGAVVVAARRTGRASTASLIIPEEQSLAFMAP